MKFNFKQVACAVAFALGLSMGGPASAATQVWSFEDDDIDFLVNPTDLTTPVTSGQLTIGQIGITVFEMPVFTKDGVNALPAGKELTGIVVAQLIAGDGTLANPWTYAPYSGGLNAVLTALGLGARAVPQGSAGEGAMIAMFENGAPGTGADRNLELNRSINPATNCTSLTDCVDQATLGSLFQVDGFVESEALVGDNFLVATALRAGAGDIGSVLALDNSLLVAAVNSAMSTFFNRDGEVGFQNILSGLNCGNPGYVADGCAQVTLSATYLGGAGLTNGAFAHSDADADKLVNVPEPTSLALLGIALAGLGAMRRRRN